MDITLQAENILLRMIPAAEFNMLDMLHLIGLCPDSISHLDLLDFIAANYQNLSYVNFKSIWKIRTLSL
jgi:hypothetical protein